MSKIQQCRHRLSYDFELIDYINPPQVEYDKLDIN